MQDGGNWYAYCGNNPVNWIDPSGLVSTPVTVTLPDGTETDATVDDGITHLPDGSRPPACSVVHTPSGDYLMTGSGYGKTAEQIDKEVLDGHSLWDILGVSQKDFKPLMEPQHGQSIYNRPPDFYVISISFGLQYGGTFSFIIDNNGNEYVSPGAYKGAPKGASLSALAFWIDTTDNYSKDKLKDYLVKGSFSFTAGAGGAISVIRPVDISLPNAYGYGVSTPQWSAGGGYTIELPTPTRRPEYMKPH